MNLPKLGQGYHLRGPAIPGTGELVHIIPANEAPSQEEVMLFYGLNPETQPELFQRAARSHKCNRLVIQRDDLSRYVIVAPEIVGRIADLILSPECPGCRRLVPSQKWHEDRCPKCGYHYKPQAPLPEMGGPGEPESEIP